MSAVLFNFSRNYWSIGWLALDRYIPQFLQSVTQLGKKIEEEEPEVPKKYVAA